MIGAVGIGWEGPHHVTLSLLASWSLILKRRVSGGESPGGDGVAGAGGVHAATPVTGSEPGVDCRGGHAGLLRKEAARIYKWHKTAGTFPPRRSRSDTS
jgi:hypothetical protein